MDARAAAGRGHGAGQSSEPQGSAHLVQVSRVNQFEAAKIDGEVMSTLREQLKQVFSLKPHIHSRYEPELAAFLHFCVWRFTIWADKPTPGNALMNLRYRNERASQLLSDSRKVRTGLEGPGLTWLQKFAFLVSMVCVPYGLARLQIKASESQADQNSWACKAQGLLQKAEKFYICACLANHLVFLRTGRYLNLVDRLLSARLIYQKPNAVRTVSSELMNRQLLWNEFSELLLMLWPLFSRSNVMKFLSWPFANRAATEQPAPKEACPVCSTKSITIPYAALPCGDLYCYYCLRTRCAGSQAFYCVKCNQKVTQIKKHSKVSHEQGSSSGSTIQ